MAGAVGAANIRLGAIVSGFIDGMRAASKEVKTLTYETNTQLTQAFKRADTQSKIFKSGITRLGTEISDLGKRMSTFGSLPIIFGGATAFKEFANLEKLKIGLTQYGESLKTVKELAKLPNVNVEGAAATLIQLRAVGVESDFAKRSITAFANALTAAGKSSVDLQPALTNVTQMLSTNAVSAADVKELANRIPQVRKALIDAFGTAEGAELTKIGAEKVVRGLIEQLEKIPKVGSGAGTAMEQFQDSVKFATASMGESINHAFNLTENIKSLGDWVEKATEKFTSLSPGVQDNVVKFGAFLAVLGPALVGVGQLIKLAPLLASGFSLIGGPITIAVTALAGFIVYYKEIIGLLEKAALAFKTYNTVARNIGAPTLLDPAGIVDYSSDKLIGGSIDRQRKERQQARRDLRAQNEQARALAAAQAEAQKLAAEQASALAKAVKGVDKAQSEALGSGNAYKDLIQQQKEAEAERLRILQQTKEIGSNLQQVDSLGQVKVWNNNDPAFDSALAEDKAGTALSGAAGTMSDTINAIGENETAYAAKARRIAQITEQMNAAISQSIRDAANDVAYGFGEMIGNLMTGAGGIEDFAKRVVGSLGQLLKDMGKSLIAAGTAGIALKLFGKNPYLALASGIALVALGTVTANKINGQVGKATTRFAKGGFAYGEMSAIVGDNPNARFDPEMIAPYSKVDQSIKQSIKESDRGGSLELGPYTIEIPGDKLRIVLERAQHNRKGLLAR